MISTPFDHLFTNIARRSQNMGGTASRSWRGIVTRVDYDKNSRVTMLFDVAPLGAWPVGTDICVGGLLKDLPPKVRIIPNVKLAFPFVTSSQGDSGFSGIVFVPEEGTIVHVEEDQPGWVITACLGMVVPIGKQDVPSPTFNPGFDEIGSALSDVRGLPLLSPLRPRDISIGRGSARLRFFDAGVMIGANPFCCDFFQGDGRKKIERALELEVRRGGYTEVHNAALGNPQLATDLAKYVLHTEITESEPYRTKNMSYVVRQTGMIPPSALHNGRSAAETVPQQMDVVTAQADRHTIIRESVIKPLAPIPSVGIPFNDLDSTAEVEYDMQVLSDGSFQVVAGSSRPGARTFGEDEPPVVFRCKLDTKTKKLRITVGNGQKATFKVEVNGATGSAEVESDKDIDVKAKGDVSITAENIHLKARNRMTVDVGAGGYKFDSLGAVTETVLSSKTEDITGAYTLTVIGAFQTLVSSSYTIEASGYSLTSTGTAFVKSTGDTLMESGGTTTINCETTYTLNALMLNMFGTTSAILGGGLVQIPSARFEHTTGAFVCQELHVKQGGTIMLNWDETNQTGDNLYSHTHPTTGPGAPTGPMSL